VIPRSRRNSFLSIDSQVVRHVDKRVSLEFMSKEYAASTSARIREILTQSPPKMASIFRRSAPVLRVRRSLSCVDMTFFMKSRAHAACSKNLSSAFKSCTKLPCPALSMRKQSSIFSSTSSNAPEVNFVDMPTTDNFSEMLWKCRL